MFKILSKDNSPYGTDFYRSTNAAIPAAYRASHVHSCDMNKSNTNSNVTINTKVPVVIGEADRKISVDTFKCTTYFTSLQHITADAERALAFDEHIKMCILARADILAGTLPDEPYNTMSSLKSVIDTFSSTLV